MFHIWVADLDSPSYFVAVAAVELGYFKQEGIDIEFVYNTNEGPELMREGKVDLIGGPAYATLRAFPNWNGVRLLCALSQYSYWFMAVRADLDLKRADLNAIKGLRISSAQSWPGMGLRHMLAEAGIDLERDNVKIVPPPPSYGAKGWMARNGIDAITEGTADAFWGNGMRVALGESLGIAKMHLDLRRGDGPVGAHLYNFAALTASEALLRDHPDVASGAVRAVVKAQQALRADPALSKRVAEKSFPADEAELIVPLIARDAPFYDAMISQEAIDGLNTFALASKLIDASVPYDQLVATQMRDIWRG
ncbi:MULTISPECIES: ABC transporter substrate-binding protein [unclassified Beijerinckia]|uniref:ABC transporter substrate-binding protein n=1 Tax=unclassified Beijerinckia TaxID=2638183 RepID=UPI000B83A414|nr:MULTISPECIES: ABC transporter substrate-binding protein [unclassified Beijerinckia]MDH7799075.1 NitT/TauT family transport system substrate-binding protein [Beijerinckia sp. GAS462]